jgi:hypothetical protein
MVQLQPPLTDDGTVLSEIVEATQTPAARGSRGGRARPPWRGSRPQRSHAP